LLAYAAVAIASGLDRASEKAPQVAPLVPDLFAANAGRRQSLTSLEARRPERARQAALLALRHDPVDGRSVGLYGQSLLGLGQARAARDAFRVSGRLGWRDPPTQFYWIAAGLYSGDQRFAATWLDAALRQSPELAQRVDLFAPFEATTAGRAAVVDRLAAVPPPAWREKYFQPSSDAAEVLLIRAQSALALAGKVGGRDCGMVAPVIGGLISRRAYTAAHQVWFAHCAMPGESSLLGDGEFTHASLIRRGTPFDWQWPESDGSISLHIGRSTNFRGMAVTVGTTAPVPRTFVTKLLALPAGRYRFGWRAAESSGAPTRSVLASLACDATTRRDLPVEQSDAHSAAFSTMVYVPQDCPAQWLKFLIGPTSDQVTFGAVTLLRE